MNNEKNDMTLARAEALRVAIMHCEALARLRVTPYRSPEDVIAIANVYLKFILGL